MADDSFSLEQVEDIQEMLGEMAQRPRTTFTKKQTIEAIMSHIDQALETRSFQEVADGLTEKGVEVSVGARRQYVSRYRRTQQKACAGKGKKRTTAAAKKTAKARTTKQGDKQPRVAKIAAKQDAASRSVSRFVEMDEDL